MTDDLDLLALAEKSAENDLAFLIRAKEDTKRLMKQSPSQDNIAAFKRAKAAVADEVARLQQGGGTSMRVFKTQLDAAAFLRDQGFKISKSQFNRDVQESGQERGRQFRGRRADGLRGRAPGSHCPG